MKALFLDRDGVINVDYGYVGRKEDFVFMQGIVELLKLFKRYDYTLFVVTNQSGIGRGYYTQEDFKALTEWMVDCFAKEGIVIEQVLFCPHVPEQQCRCRKPSTGLIEEVLQAYPVDLARSWLIGDKQSDIDLARNAKIANTIAIADSKIKGCSYAFESVVEAKEFLEKNQDTIAL